ncbi:MAG TPA: hypothetical protein PLW93_00105 [Candidatus Absconditabacterales bacterium]|nr:hypothetical protein [Candidatus Absconditabacterales bacterium]HNG96655.1 hypothetical protein [Candidatus Absconditabacterales bacterium]
MLKHKTSHLSATIKGLTVFDKMNLFLVIIFFICAILAPIGYITPISPDRQTETLRLVGIEHRKISLVIIVLLVINAGMSINSSFKSRFLNYTGIGNNIYARFFQKGIIFILLLFRGEIVLHLRETLTQTINLGRGYYVLSALIIVGLIIDFLFLQRNYKLNTTYSTITQSSNNTSSHSSHEGREHQGETFKSLFEE